MPRQIPFGPSLSALLDHQDQVISRDQAIDVGMTRHAISNRMRYDGWQEIVRDVFLCHAGEPSHRQRLIAALLYAGPDSAVDSDDALVFHGGKALTVDDEVVRVVVPQDSPARTHQFVVVRRSNAPINVVRTERLRYVDPATAVVAAARRRTDSRRVLALVSDAVQRGLVTYPELLRAHLQGPPRNARLMDAALDHIGAGVRSAPEGQFRMLAEASGVLPPLLYNCLLQLPDGQLISPDALAPEAALVHETNGRRAHARADLFDDMQERHDLMTVAGLTVLHNSPRRIFGSGREVIGQFERVYLRDRGKGLPPGVVLLKINAATAA